MRNRLAIAAAATLLVTASAIVSSAPEHTTADAARPTVTRTAPDTANRSQTRPPLTYRPPKPRPLHTQAPKKATPPEQPKHTQRPRPTPPPAPAPTDPKAYALARVGPAQFQCLEPLWEKESNWRADARNPTSGAYGIAQALPASKYASAGSDWETNAITQIRWGLGYIKAVYGTPCAAWAHSQATNWY